MSNHRIALVVGMNDDLGPGCGDGQARPVHNVWRMERAQGISHARWMLSPGSS